MKNKSLNFIRIGLNFTTNFKPSIDFKNQKMFNNGINCKLFFIFLLIIKYKNKFLCKNNIFIKKYKQKTITILKSPYRHKLARHQICLNRYRINLSVLIKLNKIIDFKGINKICKYFKLIKNIFQIFETNLIFLDNLCFEIPIKNKNNFIITKFKK